MDKILEKLFGANWRTTFNGGIEALLTAFTLGTLTFPDDWSDAAQVGKFALVVIGTFFGVRFAVVAKDKTVIGGTTQQTADGSVAKPGTQTLVDETIVASIKSGDISVTPEQKEAVTTIKK